MTEPICAMCHPATPRPGEVTGTMWRCPDHEATWDEMLAGLDMGMFQSAPITAPPPLSFAEMSALIDRFPKPVADRLVAAPDVWDRLKRVAPASSDPNPISLMAGMRVLVDEDMPPGYWEIRDGDRVVSSATTALYEETLRQIRDGAVVPDGHYTATLKKLFDQP